MQIKLTMLGMKSSENDLENEQIRILKRALAEIKQHNPSVHETPNDTNDGQFSKKKQQEESSLR